MPKIRVSETEVSLTSFPISVYFTKESLFKIDVCYFQYRSRFFTHVLYLSFFSLLSTYDLLFNKLHRFKDGYFDYYKKKKYKL